MTREVIRKWFCLVTFAIVTASGLCYSLPQSADVTGLQPAVVFTQYTPLTANSEVFRRLLSPLAQQSIKGMLEMTSRTLSEQSINLADERFVVYVPAQMPVGGYGLLVFVPPWQDAKVPLGWTPVLDSLGLIFVSAARSGNSESPIARRVPLAVLSMYNIEQQYRINPRRVYVGGFSGGSRVAMRVALAYPDVFSGALLNAGSDPLGKGGPPLPDRDLFFKFRESTRIVFITGDKDSFHTDLDRKSERSLRKWCVRNFDARITPYVSHTLANGTAVSEAFHSLDSEAPMPLEANEACKAATDNELSEELKKVAVLIATGHRSHARRLLLSIDSGYGGLALPQIVHLARQCDCGLMPSERGTSK